MIWSSMTATMKHIFESWAAVHSLMIAQASSVVNLGVTAVAPVTLTLRTTRSPS
mgnify:CR=1 FL=1